MQGFTLVTSTYPYYWVKKSPHSKGTIFYIHGFADQPTMFWQKFVPEHDYDVYAVELPGHFETPIKSLKDLDPIKFGKLCVNLIQELELNNMIVMGHSMGGGIAIEIAAKLPQLVKQLVLIHPANSHCSTFASFWQMLTNFTPTTPEQLKQFYKHLAHADHYALLARTLGREAIANFKARKVNYNIIKRNTAKLRNLHNMARNEKLIQCPTLLILGVQDGAISHTKTAKHLRKQIADLSISMFDHAGHFAFLEQPEEFNTTVNRFLTSAIDK